MTDQSRADRALPVAWLAENTDGTFDAYKDVHSLIDDCRQGFPVFRADSAKPAGEPWITVEQAMPKPGVVVLAFYRNKYGQGRIVRAHHAPKHTIDASHWEDADTDDTEDGSFEPEGWYEDPAVGENLAFISESSDGRITHWMRLPAYPDALAAAPAPAEPAAPVLTEIMAERARQDAQWGGPAHDDEHYEDDWRHYIRKQLAEMNDTNYKARERFIKIAALSVAAVESMDRKYGAPATKPEPASEEVLKHEYRKGFIDGQIDMRDREPASAPSEGEK